MKKILVFIFFFAIIAAGAQSAIALEIPNPLGANTITGLIKDIADWLLKIGLIISTIIILWAAIVFMTSGGNVERVTMARKTLWYAIIGIVILLLADGVAISIDKFLNE